MAVAKHRSIWIELLSLSVAAAVTRCNLCRPSYDYDTD